MLVDIGFVRKQLCKSFWVWVGWKQTFNLSFICCMVTLCVCTDRIQQFSCYNFIFFMNAQIIWNSIKFWSVKCYVWHFIMMVHTFFWCIIHGILYIYIYIYIGLVISLFICFMNQQMLVIIFQTLIFFLSIFCMTYHFIQVCKSATRRQTRHSST